MLQPFKILIFLFTLYVVFVSPKGIKVGFFIWMFFFRTLVIIILGFLGYEEDFSSIIIFFITLIWGDVIILGVEALFIFETSLLPFFNSMSYSTTIKEFERRLTFVSSTSLLEPPYKICYFFIKVVILFFCLLYGFKGCFIVWLVTLCTCSHFICYKRPM